MDITTKAHLKKLVKIWQKRLRLQDWEIEVAFDKTLEVSGFVRALPKTKMARISILPSESFPKDWLLKNDIELTLVHEMLHIQAGTLNQIAKENTPEGTDLELFVELTAQALVEAYRNGN